MNNTNTSNTVAAEVDRDHAHIYAAADREQRYRDEIDAERRKGGG